MKGIVCQKLGMLQVWNDTNALVPVTALKIEDNYVVGSCTQEKNKYSAIQIGYHPISNDKINKPIQGKQKKSFELTQKYFKHTLEIRDFPNEQEIGSQLKGDLFQVGDKVTVQGITKGKGFQGVVKKYGFHGGRKTHGSHFHRSPGAIGACADPGRVEKGKKMPGHMGAKTKSIRNLIIHSIDQEENIILIKGAVPGHKGNTVLVYQK